VISWKYRLKVGPYILVIGMLLIFGTVYLRYHYLIDILAGALLAIPCLLTSRRICGLLKDSDVS
jgi:membrane-associated phospholipid phosphatase